MRPVIVLGIATAVLASGCGAQKSGNDADSPSRAQSCSYDSPGTLLPALKHGFGDETSVHIDMKMDAAGQKVAVAGDMEMTQKDTAMTLKSTGASEFAMIAVDGRLFMSQSASTPKYIEIKADNPASAALRQQLDSANLRTTFKAFDAGLTKVKPSGATTIDGTSVCEYLLTVDARKAARAQGQTQLPASMPKTVEYHLFLDGDDHMRRMKFDLGPVSMVMNMTHWDEPVDISVPKIG
ncbi:hypothetical protein [Nocardioides jejuensis]|uniref:LppX_LprAFG lipoprotein n=1 Tax=Nocardioides jejuensis TaxID=2502782 RepID=A0A4R1BW56_9ACTN|nr:hypothetical protein [Nocardioides jejuensis]TCJ22270.1 hypothetical protein EPD65_13085 [Nocardioides jejuensis]